MPGSLAPIPFIYNLLTEGVGPTAGLRAFRAAGGAIRTQRFFHAYGEVAAAVSRRPMVERLPPEAVPGRESVSRITSHATPGFLYRVAVVNTVRGVVTEAGTVGEETIVDWVSVRSHRLLTIAEAMAQAEALIASGYRAESGSVAVLGSAVHEIAELVPEGEDVGA